jgi:hypothetical protein
MDFAVNGVSLAGSVKELHFDHATEVTITARVAALCSESPQNPAPREQSEFRRSGATDIPDLWRGERFYWDIELARLPGRREVMVEVVMNGERAEMIPIRADGRPQDLKVQTRVEQSCWIALRIFPSSHTNPIYVIVDDKPIRASKSSAEWCLHCIEESWKLRMERIKPSELVAAQSACDLARNVFDKLRLEM